MYFDVFCSLSQTPRGNGILPSHAQLMSEFLDQAVAADELGYGCVWAAESHFSSELQKQHAEPVIPHWTGEVGVNSDTCQLASQVFARTQRIEVGSAIMNIVACGGPISAAERVANTLAWHGLDPAQTRRFNVGFAGGRFDFIARTTGIKPRSAWEQAAWRQVKTAIMQEAGEIFVRLLSGEPISSSDVAATVLTVDTFRSREEFDRIARMAGAAGDTITVPPRWEFELTGIVPTFRSELLTLLTGTHEIGLQKHFNRFAPVRVFNLSITQPAVIEDTHRRMAGSYHPAGGPWQRSHLPRTVFVFVDAQPGRSTAHRRAAARERAQHALGGYWRALDGTLDETKVATAADNALIGAPEDVAHQIVESFHSDDRLMLWFDFFADHGAQVTNEMSIFAEQVIPAVRHLAGIS